MNLEENSKLKVSINFQFLVSDEELINPSHSKLQKYQDGRSHAQKCTEGKGREGEGTQVGRTCPCYPHSQGLTYCLDGYVPLVSFWTGSLEKSVKVGEERFTCVVQSNTINMDTKGAIESVPIKRR